MGNSETKKRRKNTAQDIEDECFTIRTEIENMKSNVSYEASELKKLSLDDLKAIREAVQRVLRDLKFLNARTNYILNLKIRY